MTENDGTARLIKAIRKQSSEVFNFNQKSNLLGTVTSNGIQLDGIDDVIPRNELLYLQSAINVSPNDRVLCTPCGDYFIVIEKLGR